MKILFICSSQEPGRDGIGDYTRHLARELSKKGCDTSIIALYDRHLNTPVIDTEIDTIPVLRLSGKHSLQNNLTPARKWIEKRKPDVISLQYVPYGFQAKGLPFQLPAMIKKLGQGSKVHIMFHELWLGESKDSTLKEKILGFLQRKITDSLVKNSGFGYTFANAAFYADCLQREGIQAQVMPIFNSLPVGTGNSHLLNRFPGYIFKERKKYVIAAFFGGTHYHLTLKEKVVKLNEMIQATGKVLVAVHIGKGKPEASFIEVFSSQQIEFIILGEQIAKDAADFFVHIDLGLSTYPKILYQKSSSMASMLNNGLPMVLLRNSFEDDNREINEVKEVEEIKSINSFINQPKSFTYQYSADYTVEQYLKLF